MRKSIALAVVFMMVVFGVSACGSKSSSYSTPATTTANVTGTWKGAVTMGWADGSHTSDTTTLVLTQNNNTVSGTMTSQSDNKNREHYRLCGWQ